MGFEETGTVVRNVSTPRKETHNIIVMAGHFKKPYIAVQNPTLHTTVSGCREGSTRLPVESGYLATRVTPVKLLRDASNYITQRYYNLHFDWWEEKPIKSASVARCLLWWDSGCHLAINQASAQ